MSLQDLKNDSIFIEMDSENSFSEKNRLFLQIKKESGLRSLFPRVNNFFWPNFKQSFFELHKNKEASALLLDFIISSSELIKSLEGPTLNNHSVSLSHKLIHSFDQNLNNKVRNVHLSSRNDQEML